MKLHTTPLLMGTLVVLLPLAAFGQSSRESRIRQLAETGTFYDVDVRSTVVEPDNKDEAGDHMIEMAGQLQALYDLGGPGLSEDAREEITTRSGVLANSVSRLIGFIDDVRRPPEAESDGENAIDTPVASPSVPEEDYDARTLRLVQTYLGLVDPLTQFINGDPPLEAEALESLQEGLATVEALALALPGSDF